MARKPLEGSLDGKPRRRRLRPRIPRPEFKKRGSGRRLTGILQALAGDEARERVSVGDMLSVMGERAFGALMLVFALPNVLPTPPGTSALLGMPLLFLAMQLMLGQKPWLPQWIAQRSMTRSDFNQIVARAEPVLSRAERMLRPRIAPLVYGMGERAIGGFCLLLAAILVLPIPLGNMLPALAICLFSFALLERDGLWAIAGYCVGIISTVIVGGVVYALIKAALFLFFNTFT
jgi:hypothetical protein